MQGFIVDQNYLSRMMNEADIHYQGELERLNTDSYGVQKGSVQGHVHLSTNKIQMKQNKLQACLNSDKTIGPRKII